MKIAIVGVTGMVGKVMLEVLAQRKFPLTELIPVASEKSVGQEVEYRGRKYQIVTLEMALSRKPDIALFSAGSSVSLEWAPKFASMGTRVIDNSSAWRMDHSKKLIVPEINAHKLSSEDMIIANPNCSTTQLVMCLAPLHKKFSIKRVVISTYQSITGTGVKAVQQLEDESKGQASEKAYPHQIFENALPHCDDFEELGYTKEELKLVRETHKILDEVIAVTATAVRIPVIGGHSEAVNIEFENHFEIEEIRNILLNTVGVTLMDDIENNIYPMPIIARGKDDVFVGRIRRDLSQENSLNLFIVSDNLRKGAATNTVQIAEYLIQHNFIKRT